MARLTETIGTINSFLRTLLTLGVLGVVGTGAWFGYQAYSETFEQERHLRQTRDELAATRTELDKAHTELAARTEEVTRKNAEIASLNTDLQLKQEQIEKLDTALRLLKVDHRVARLTVLDQTRDPQTDELTTTVEFVELDDQGQPLDEPRVFPIRGDVVYVDNWVVKFDDEYVEQADLSRSTSLVLFRRIFGEQQQPQEGFPLDKAGGAPRVYSRGGVLSDFERQIWSDFWLIANDEVRARELGIRAAHGEAVSIKVLPGKTYKLLLRASDGLSIIPVEGEPKRPRPAA